MKKVLSYVLGIALLLFIWWSSSEVIIWLLDFNLWAIKQFCNLINYVRAPYGTMLESALRLGLHADKALLFAEGIWAARAALGFLSPSSKVQVSSHR